RVGSFTTSLTSPRLSSISSGWTFQVHFATWKSAPSTDPRWHIHSLMRLPRDDEDPSTSRQRATGELSKTATRRPQTTNPAPTTTSTTGRFSHWPRTQPKKRTSLRTSQNWQKTSPLTGGAKRSQPVDAAQPIGCRAECAPGTTPASEAVTASYRDPASPTVQLVRYAERGPFISMCNSMPLRVRRMAFSSHTAAVPPGSYCFSRRDVQCSTSTVLANIRS